MRWGRNLFAAACLSVADEAWAFATCDPGAPTVLLVAPIEVPANPQMGAVLGDPNGYAFDVPDAMRCTYDPNLVIDYWSFMTFTRNRPFIGYWLDAQGWRMPVYQSGVTGVGIGMVAQDRDGGAYVGVGGQATLRAGENPGIPSWGVRGRLFFFVTGNIQGGVMPGQTLASLNVYTSTRMHDIQIGTTRIGPPSKPTCVVSTPSLAMRLGDVSIREFNGIGSVAGSTTETISLACSGGTGAMLDVRVTLTDQSNPANRSDRLSLAAGSTASGVALQLLYNSQLLSYGDPNQWLAGSTDNGVFQIPLTARYIQTERLIRPGTANGLATFTMNYR